MSTGNRAAYGTQKCDPNSWQIKEGISISTKNKVILNINIVKWIQWSIKPTTLGLKDGSTNHYTKRADGESA